jgi:hypothetical protein
VVWWTYLVFRIPELIVVLVGLGLALVRRHTLGGRAAGLAMGGFASLVVSMLLGVAVTVLLFTNPGVSGRALSPFVVLQIADILLVAIGLALVVAAVFAGRDETAPASAGYAGWGASAGRGASTGGRASTGRAADNGQPPVAGGWTPPQQAEPADWRIMSGVWALPRERFDQPPS